MSTLPRALPALFVLVLFAIAAPASATVVVPVPDDQLAAGAAAVVVGRVSTIVSHWDPSHRRIVSDITVALDEIVAGNLPVVEVTVRQAGGQVGDVRAWIEGSPTFRRGERVLLFLTTRADGTLRVAHLYQGKFSIETDPATGEDVAVRGTPDGVHALGARGAASRREKLADFKTRIRAARGAARRPSIPPVTAPATAAGAVTQTQDAFTFFDVPARWFEPDAGQSVPMFIRSGGEPRAPTSGLDQVRAGENAWSQAVGTSFRYRDAGMTDAAAGFAFDGVNAVSFGDPAGDIDPPAGCTGTLAIGGYYRSGTETRVVNGQTFYRILEGDVVFADGWDGCGFYETYTNLAEVATHELGHVLGLGHSADPDATMYAFAHFDGRGAALRADDVAGVSFMYPGAPVTLSVARTGAGTVTSSPAGINCGTDCSESYATNTQVTLAATPAAGATFAGWSGGCTGTGACTVRMTAAATVTAAFQSGPVTAGFTAPAAGATVSGTTTVTMTASGGVAPYTYKLAADGAVVYVGSGNAFSWNTTTVPNGGHTLAVTATDSTATASSPVSQTVTVSNTTTTPPPTGTLTLAITAPKPGATVSGTAWAVLWLSGTTSTSNTYVLTLGGVEVARTTTASRGPVSIPYDSKKAPNGSQTLAAKATDSAGKTGSAQITVTVSNTGTTPTPTPSAPTAAFLAPAAGATVSGTTTVTMSATGGSGSGYTYKLSVDGTQVFSGATASFAWNTTAVANGGHTLALTVIDSAGKASAPVTRTVTVSNTTVVNTLQLYITSPKPGAVVSGTGWVVLWLNGTTSTSNTYTLTVNGIQVAQFTTASRGPVSIPWNTKLVANGSYTLNATARDSAGKTGLASVSIMVRN